MNIFLGNLQFDEIESKLGFKLTKEDKKIWDRYHTNSADVTDNKFHVFDIPRCIVVKGKEAREVVLKIFSKNKIVKAMGEIAVYTD